MDITIFQLPAENMKAKITDESQLGFGRHFTDRMLLVEWKAGQGWGDARMGRLCYKSETLQLGGGKVGEITRQLYDNLTGIQTGKREDTIGWVKFVG